MIFVFVAEMQGLSLVRVAMDLGSLQFITSNSIQLHLGASSVIKMMVLSSVLYVAAVGIAITVLVTTPTTIPTSNNRWQMLFMTTTIIRLKE